MVNENYYEILGLPREASGEEIRKKYRTLALKMHPDKIHTSEKEKKEGEERFKKINTAYEVLHDEKRRKLYDQFGRESPEPSSDFQDTERSYSNNQNHCENDRDDYFDNQSDFRFPSDFGFPGFPTHENKIKVFFWLEIVYALIIFSARILHPWYFRVRSILNYHSYKKVESKASQARGDDNVTGRADSTNKFGSFLAKTWLRLSVVITTIYLNKNFFLN